MTYFRRSSNNNRWLRSLISLPVILITLFGFFQPKPVQADKIVCGTPGKDGPSVISGIVNSYYPGSASTSSSAISITLGTLDGRGSSTTISVGDLLLVIQMQGADINTFNDMRYGAGLGIAGNQSSPGSGNLNTNFSAGQYEYVIASNTVGAGGGTLNITSSLVNTYYNANYGTQGQRRFQVIRVPQYSSASLGGILTAPAWNGVTGGIVILDVAGNFDLNGKTIDVNGLGFRGGAGIQMGGDPSAALSNLDLRTSAPGTIPNQTTYGGGPAVPQGASGSNQTNAAKGEGTAGTPRYVNFITASGYPSLNDTTLEGYPSGSMGRGAPGNAGGGGTDGGPATNEFNSGGGGGGNGGTGGNGGNSYNQNVADGGWGGSVFGAAGSSTVSPTLLTMGGGGGAGTTNNGTYSYYNGTTVQDDPQTGNNAFNLLGFNPALLSSGQPGGGIVMVRAGTVTGTGTINAKGKSGYRVTTSPNANSPYEVNWDGGGGGGAGGSVVVITQNATSPTLTVNAQGGDGGNTNHQRNGSPPPHGPGGGGGGGVVYTSFSIANPANAVNGGVHGWSGSTLPWDTQFNAQSGSTGVIDQTRSTANFSYSISGASCIPEVSTTKTTSTPMVTQTSTGTSGTYTINVANASGKGTAISFVISDFLPTNFTYESTTSINLSGGATRPSTSNPTVGSGNPAWGVFNIPGGGQVQITFVVHITAGTIGTFQNPATATYNDPTRTISSGTTVKSYDPVSSTNEDIHVLGYLAVTTAIHGIGHSVITSSIVGTTVHDSVSVTGSGATPTGTVTFKYFSNGTCTDPAAATSSTFTLSSGSVDGTTFTQTPATAGSYSFQATYNGDSNYSGATSSCELLDVGKATPTLTTTATGSATVGSNITDTAHLSGGYDTLGGSITFDVFAPGDTTCATPISVGPARPVSGANDYTSGTYLTTAVGNYRWIAHYSGDTNNNAVDTACNDTGETSSVGKASPTVTTSAEPADGTVGVLSYYGDNAWFTGGYNPSGSVTFTLYSDSSCTVPVPGMSGSSPVISTGYYAVWADIWTPANAGTFYWIASYSGDSNNNGFTTSCGDTNEQIVIGKASPSISTLPGAGGTVGVTLTDTATLTGGYSPTGTVTFKLFPPTDPTCTGSAVYTDTAFTAPYSTGFGYTSDATGTWHWTADYNGDSNNKTASSSCISEPVLVTAAVIDAVDDTGGPVNGLTGATNVLNVLTNDTLNGLPTDLGQVDLSYLGGDPELTLNSDGSVDVAAGTAAGSYTFDYQICEILNPTNCDTATVTVTVYVDHPGINLSKDPATQTVVTGSNVDFTLTVTNTGDVPLSDVAVADAQCDSLTGPTGDTTNPGVLDTTETWTYGCTVNGVTTDFTNSASVHGTPPVGPDASDEASADVTMIHPGIRLSKDPATQSILVGSDASFTLTVTNTGDVPLSDVAVSDAQCDSLTGPTGDTSNPGVLDTTETWIYSCTVNGVTTDFTNSASVHGTPPLGSDVNASDSADVTVNKADITVVTDIHNSSHDVVTTVPAESSVHDSATLTFAGAAPTGTVDFLFYSTDDCSGMSVVVGSGVSISDGFADSSVNEGPLSAGSYSFKAHYSGDANYVAKDGACEPLTVTPLGPFDPPFGIKTVNAKGLPILTWTMVWINNANHVPIIAAVHDPIPNGSTYVGGSLVCTPSGTSSTVPVPPSVDGCYFEAPSGSYPRGRIVWTGVIGPDFGATSAATAANELTITYSVTVDNGTNRAVNIATIDSDLNGDGNTTDPGEQRVASARSSWSRTGEPIIPVTGFAPGRTTVLPPLAPLFKGLGDITLEVPSLGINIPVVGIPQVASNTWDVSWLGKDAGWLAGSAFPTWDGNSVLTAHVYDANGNPGPFVNVYKLKWGDRVIIEAWGTQYTYEVREVLQVNPDDVSAMMKHQTSPWLTLVTCRGYDESLDSYLYRVLVRAVLVSVK